MVQGQQWLRWSGRQALPLLPQLLLLVLLLLLLLLS